MALPSCIPQTPEQQLQNAAVVFEGVALEGPTATGVQRFRADRYVKGDGPAVVAVSTGVVARPDGTGSITSVSVEAAAGERWRVYVTKSADGRVLETSVCAGSTKLAGRSSTGSGTDGAWPGSVVSAPEVAGSGVDRRLVALGGLLLGLTLLSAALMAGRFRRRAS